MGLHVETVVRKKFVDGAHDVILQNRQPSSVEREGKSLRSPEEVTMDSMDQVREELRQPALALHELIPDVMKSYVTMSTAAMADGDISVAVKELLAIVIAITRECDGCIVAHTRAGLRAGVTRQQLGEAIGVAIVMNGGPGTVWGPRALRAFDEADAARKS